MCDSWTVRTDKRRLISGEMLFMRGNVDASFQTVKELKKSQQNNKSHKEQNL
jgi:hypothetical protein